MPTVPSANNPTNIPQPVRDRPQWVAWKYIPDPNRPKPQKVPYDPTTGEAAKPNDPTTWGTFKQTVDLYRSQRLDGLGYVFTGDDSFTGVDLDNCRDPDTGVIAAWAQEIIDAHQSYSEVSPSGTGVHILVEAKLPITKVKEDDIEIFCNRCYFTVTGNHLDGTSLTIEPRQAQVEALYQHVLAIRDQRKRCEATSQGQVSTEGQESSPTLSDEDILSLARSAKNSVKFAALYDRGVTSANGGDESAADLALCGMLAFYSQDPEQLNRLFQASALYRPKWDTCHASDGRTYGEMTIAKALKGLTERYIGGGQSVYTGGVLPVVLLMTLVLVARREPRPPPRAAVCVCPRPG
jgi:primase-polymerase (primpol)-like protein